MRTLIALMAAATSVAAAPAVVAKIPWPPCAAPCAAAAGGRFVWVSEYGSPYVVKINPKTNKVVGKTKIGFGSCGLGYGAGSMWIEDTSSSTISRVSVTNGQAPESDPGRQHALRRNVRLRFRLDDVLRPRRARAHRPGPKPHLRPLEAGPGDGRRRRVRLRLGGRERGRDPRRSRLEQAGSRRSPSPAAPAGPRRPADAVWVTTPTGLARIDPQTNAVTTTIPLPGAPALGDPDVVDGIVWVPQIRRNTIAVVDPATNTVARTVKAGVGPFVVTQIGGQAWVPSWKGHDIWRIKP